MTDIAFDHDVEALERDATARGGISVNDQKTPTPRRAGGLARIAAQMDGTRHHVLGESGRGITLDHDLGIFVHASAVVADVALNFDRARRIHPHCHRMLARDIRDPPSSFCAAFG